MRVSLIVTDAGPLITLAMAQALDTLLLLNVPAIVPDMVEYDVASHVDKPDTVAAASWRLVSFWPVNCSTKWTRPSCCLQTPHSAKPIS